MAKTLTNGKVSIVVEDHGAELSSIKYNGREYLWGADPEFWKRHSPVLFPIVGSVWNGEYRSKKSSTTDPQHPAPTLYKMGQHGLARDMDFTLCKESEDYVEYVLHSTEETLKKYPYPFVLNIGYRLCDNTIEVIWKVTNPAPQEGQEGSVMAFSIGAHPAFHWPMLSNEAIESGVGAMKEELAKTNDRGYFYFNNNVEALERTLITEGGCVDVNQKQPVALQDGYLKLDTDVFGKDALVLENNQVQEVTLCDDNKTPYLTLKWDAPLVGLWSPPGKNAPFVCIEPWYGRADRAHYEGYYEDKDWIQKLASGETFEVKYDIIIR